MESPRHTCLKLQISNNNNSDQPIFVKATWFSDHFDLSVTDGLLAWTCHGIPSLLLSFKLLLQNIHFTHFQYLFPASKDEVRERASQWDQPVSEYIDLAEKYLGFQQPGSVYGFSDAGDGHKRVSTSNLSSNCFIYLYK